MTLHPVDIAFDYSLNCPALCIDGSIFIFIHAGDEVEYVKDKMLILGRHYNFRADGNDYPARIARLTNIFIKDIQSITAKRKLRTAAFEDYALSKMRGGQNRMLQIAEATGTMKSACALLGANVVKVNPRTAKKTAGYGRYNKEQMADAFEQEHGFHVHDILGCNKGASPSADIVDSYYVWKTVQNW